MLLNSAGATAAHGTWHLKRPDGCWAREDQDITGVPNYFSDGILMVPSPTRRTICFRRLSNSGEIGARLYSLSA